LLFGSGKIARALLLSRAFCRLLYRFGGVDARKMRAIRGRGMDIVQRIGFLGHLCRRRVDSCGIQLFAPQESFDRSGPKRLIT
jgi:hypothetical protein